jgi:hypothetical protein
MTSTNAAVCTINPNTGLRCLAFTSIFGLGIGALLLSLPGAAQPPPALPPLTPGFSFYKAEARYSVYNGSMPLFDDVTSAYHTCSDVIRHYAYFNLTAVCKTVMMPFKTMTISRPNQWLKDRYESRYMRIFTEYSQESCSELYDRTCKPGSLTQTFYTTVNCSGTPNNYTQFIGNPQEHKDPVFVNGTYVPVLNMSVGIVGGEYYYTCV